ncbi:hypothetical protein [Natrinema ejinorense]|uniref:hypothetical protein n=1 Tax=Natrinema ejinorense TaxID=373386 RepID=UPI00117E25DA|nr:hypothetical protein [Natrinema ejinorense]
MKVRSILSRSLIIAILLTGTIFYSGALTKPYSGDSEYYAIAHESSAAYNEYIDHASHGSDGGIPVEDFSENQRRAFEEAKKQEPSSSGRQSLGKPPVCSPTLLLCDEYEEFPHPANDGSHDHGYIAVEDSTGDQFIVKIGQADPIGGIEQVVMFITKVFVLGPYALFLAYRGWSDRSPEPTFLSVGYGATLLTIVFAYPYILMFTEISLPSWHLPFLAIVTWSVILAEVYRDRNKINQN